MAIQKAAAVNPASDPNINLAALKTELQTDPNQLGYAPLIAALNDSGLADLLNTTITANKVNTKWLAVEALPGLVTAADFQALTNVQQNYLAFLMRGKGFDLSDPEIKKGLIGNNGLFSSTTKSYANIIAAQQRDGSRAETLFGAGVVIDVSDIAKALRG